MAQAIAVTAVRYERGNSMRFHRGTVALVLAFGSYGGLAVAQTIPLRPAYQYPAKPEAGPTSIQIPNTPLYVAPYVGLGVGHDDNIFYRNVDQRASNLVVTSLGLKVDSRTADTVFRASYQGQYGQYTSSHED